jgi:hypothetical protein
MAQGRKSSQSGHQGAMTMPKNQVNTPSRANGKPRSPRGKFVYFDPLAIDKRLLYKTPDGKYRIGLVLETEQQPNGYFLVRQAAPSAPQMLAFAAKSSATGKSSPLTGTRTGTKKRPPRMGRPIVSKTVSREKLNDERPYTPDPQGHKERIKP